jgi:hypothetical protein
VNQRTSTGADRAALARPVGRPVVSWEQRCGAYPRGSGIRLELVSSPAAPSVLGAREIGGRRPGLARSYLMSSRRAGWCSPCRLLDRALSLAAGER